MQHLKKLLILIFWLCSSSIAVALPVTQLVRIQYPEETWYVLPYHVENLNVTEERCGTNCLFLKLTSLKGGNASLHFNLVDLGRFFVRTSEVVVPFDVQSDKMTTAITSYRMKWGLKSLTDMVADVKYLSFENSYFINIADA